MKQKYKIKSWLQIFTGVTVVLLASVFLYLQPAVKVFAQTGSTPLGTTCNSAADCASGYCNPADGCQPLVAGVSCSLTVNNCNTSSSGLVCTNGACQAPNGSGANNPTSNNSTQTNTTGSGSPIVCPSGLSNVNGICLPPNNFNSGIASSTSIPDFLIKVINILLTLAGIVAVVVLIIGGFWYISSAGNEEQSEKGKKAIINAIIGLLVIVLAFAIVTVISNTVTNGNLSSGNVTTSGN